MPAPRQSATGAAARPDAGESATQAGVRAANLAVLLRAALAADRPPSRADLAAATALTRSTVSRLVDELVAGGLLAEAERDDADRRPGRPATPLVAPRGTVVGLGLQVNAGYLAAVLTDLSGEVLAREVVPGDHVGADSGPTFEALAALGQRALESAAVAARHVGTVVALPGLVSPPATLRRAPNLGWSDLEVGDLLAGRWGHPVLAGNEADLAALTVAEPRPGVPGGRQDFVYLSGEIGVGGAAVVGGTVLSGTHGWAGEVGHVCVDPSGPECRCGSTGCLEQYAGRMAVLSAAGLPPSTAPERLATLAAEGDPRATAAIDRAGWALGVALAGVVNVLDIPTVVLGGHLALLGPALVDRAGEVLRSRVLSAATRPPSVEVVTDPLDPAPGAAGAALRALAPVVADPAAWLDAR